MVKSEAELKRFTKQQLVQWLTRHDQRLPTVDKLKPYYLERALKYFKLLQKENAHNPNVPSSRSKSKGKVPSSPGRTKRKGASAQSSLTPKSRGRQPVVNRTKRRHSAMNEEGSKKKRTVSRSPSRSRKKVHKIPKKKSPAKNPAMQSALRKKRERVRRQTADPLSLSQLADDASSSDHDDSDLDIAVAATGSESDVGYKSAEEVPMGRSEPAAAAPAAKRQFVCERDPSKMTINDLQQWLDDHRIAFEVGRRKAAYVSLVRQHSVAGTKRVLSPQHKDRNSPRAKKPKSYSSPIRDRDAPLPQSLRQSPLTPNDDARIRSKMRGHREGAGSLQKGKSQGLLSTPSLNKTGVQKINTPSKLAMRDEIRSILMADHDDEPLRPVGHGVTPGGPGDEMAEDLDHRVLGTLLSDLRGNGDGGGDHEEGSNPSSPRVARPNYGGRPLLDDDEKKEAPGGQRQSYYDRVMAQMASPPQFKSASRDEIAKDAKRVFATTTNKKKHKLNTSSFRANRTMPSPASPEAVESMDSDPALNNNNGNCLRGRGASSPLADYQRRLEMDDVAAADEHCEKGSYFEDEPMSPTIAQRPLRAKKKMASREEALLDPRKRERAQPVQRITSAPKVGEMEHVATNQQPNRFTPDTAHRLGRHRALSGGGGVDGVHRAEPVPAATTEPKKGGRCGSVLKLVAVSSIMAAVAFAVHCVVAMDGAHGGRGMAAVHDAVSALNALVGELADYASSGRDPLFCDAESVRIAGLPHFDGECTVCPENAVSCADGVAQCAANHVLRASKCVMDGVLIQFAYDIRDQAARLLAERKGRIECGEMEGAPTMHRNELLSRCEIVDASKLESAFDYFDREILPDAATMQKRGDEYFSTKTRKSPMCRAREWAVDNVLGLVALFCVFCVVIATWRRWKGQQRESELVALTVTEVFGILEDALRFSRQPFVPVDVVRQRAKPQPDRVWRRVNAAICHDAKIRKSVKFIDGTHKNCWQLVKVDALSVSQQGFREHSGQWSPNRGGADQRDGSGQRDGRKFGGGLVANAGNPKNAGFAFGGQAPSSRANSAERDMAYGNRNQDRW